MTLQEITEKVKKIPLSSRSQHRQIQEVFKAFIDYLREIDLKTPIPATQEEKPSIDVAPLKNYDRGETR